MNQRIDEIRNLITEDPDDPFLHYALALEYLKIRDMTNADHCFTLLRENFPAYLPAYYHAAHFYWEKDEHLIASKLFETGINLAEQKEDEKTRRELENAYQNFLLDMD